MNYQKGKLKNNPIYKCIMKNKIHCNKFNQGCKRLVYLENYNKLKIQINGSTYPVHRLEKLTSLKCPCYTKQSIDSVQCLLKYQ